MRYFLIYGITYGDKKTEFIEYRNNFTEKLWRFENNPMLDIVDNMISDLGDEDYLGILSWKFHQKSGLSKEGLIAKLNGSPDVFNLSKHIPLNYTFMDWSDEGHKGIRDFVISCCEHVGLKYNNDPEYIVYANQFIAKKSIYVDYINRVIKPSLELLEGEMWEQVNKDPGYTRSLPGVHYNYIPFILERMMMQYIDNLKLTTVNIL